MVPLVEPPFTALTVIGVEPLVEPVLVKLPVTVCAQLYVAPERLMVGVNETRTFEHTDVEAGKFVKPGVGLTVAMIAVLDVVSQVDVLL
jgi:hypothetical protein